MNAVMSETTRRPLCWFKVVPQVRTDLGAETDLKNLGESLRERQLSPVAAMACGDLIYGFRRLEAARLVGLPDLAVTIYAEALDESEIKSIQLTENIHRLDMTPYDKWIAYEELRRLNPDWSVKQLAHHLKFEPPAVTKWLSPSKCIASWRDAFKAGRVGITDCYAASQASEVEQREMLEMKLAGASRDALSRFVGRTKPQSQEQAVRVSRISIPLACGTRIVITGERLSLADVVEKLTECLAAARNGVRERLDSKTWQSVMRDKSQA